MCLTKHAQRRIQERGKPFGIDLDTATELVDNVLKQLPLDDALVILGAASEQVRLPDGSNGDLLCARLRDGVATTVLLRRATQKTRLDQLPYVIAKTLEVL